jgi:hypothetical protein
VRRRLRDAGDAPGHDSFLDIVTNIVGILIILVMVVGVRTKDAWMAAALPEKPVIDVEPVAAEASAADATAPEADPEEELPPIDVETPTKQANSIEREVREIEVDIARMKMEIAARMQERMQAQLLATAIERSLDEHAETMDQQARRDFELNREILRAEAELDSVRQQREVVENELSEVEVIRHLPTPLAQTVFGKEQHFRLMNGRLAYVPLHEFLAKLKAEASGKIWKLKESPRVTEMIGPISGFRMKYTLKMVTFAVDTGMGPAMRKSAQLDGFILIPVSENLGTPVERALRKGSEFHSFVSGLDPRATTITVWTYPDSFESFREIRDTLYELGFSVAARPLPHGHPIGGSPNGSRSASQ